MNEMLFKQLIAELLDAQEQALAILANATADAVGRPAFAASLEQRIANAKAAASHPTRDKLLATALRAVKA
jgi:hypothetical protein